MSKYRSSVQVVELMLKHRKAEQGDSQIRVLYIRAVEGRRVLLALWESGLGTGRCWDDVVHSAGKFRTLWTPASDPRLRSSFRRYVWPRNPSVRDRDTGALIRVQPLILSLLSVDLQRDGHDFFASTLNAQLDVDFFIDIYILRALARVLITFLLNTTRRARNAVNQGKNERSNDAAHHVYDYKMIALWKRSAPDTCAKWDTFLTALIFKGRTWDRSLSIFIHFSVSSRVQVSKVSVRWNAFSLPLDSRLFPHMYKSLHIRSEINTKKKYDKNTNTNIVEGKSNGHD